jgi:hypothetical protein
VGTIVKLPWDITATGEASYGASPIPNSDGSTHYGVAGLVGVKTALGKNQLLYGTYSISQDRDDLVTSQLAVGGREKVPQTPLTLFAEDQFRDGRDALSGAVGRSHMQSVGADLPLARRFTLGATFERGDVADAGVGQTDPPLRRTGGALHGSYAGDRLRVQLKGELRQDDHLITGQAPLLSWLASGAATLKLHRDFTVRARVLAGFTHDGSCSATVQPSAPPGSPVPCTQTVEASAGFSWRPSWIDGAALLGRYSYVDDVAPTVQQPGAGAPFAELSHSASLGGEARLFWRISLGEKVAFKLRRDPAGDQWMYLWVNRLSLHVTQRIDAVVEYRWLAQPGLASRQGIAVEANYLLGGHLRLGVGYNFTDFSDDELQLGRGTEHGVFVRAQGYY